jgi:replicative DNA helicase
MERKTHYLFTIKGETIMSKQQNSTKQPIINTASTQVTSAKHTSPLAPFTAVNMKTYLHDIMPTDMAEFINGSKTKTGYANLDALTNLYPGLYVIGAISSLGKTTFINQMSDQLAESGEHVIYFSLEQSTLELASKSLSRIMAKKNSDTALTSLQIRKNGNDERVADAVATYDNFANNITIVECNYRTTINDIEQYVNDFINQRKIKPVVVTDYLQVIPSDDPKLSTKELVDMNVRRLKQLQEDNKIAVIVISSLNRQNYLTQIDYESFKESGGIEYTADVVWGLQLEVLHDDIFDSQAKINEKRQKVKDAKAAIPRRIELCCMKNRFGMSSYSCMFNYYPQFDYFVPDTSTMDNKLLNTDFIPDKDGFVQVPEGYDLPFN